MKSLPMIAALAATTGMPMPSFSNKKPSRTKGVWRGDGYDQMRIDRAEAKRYRKAMAHGINHLLSIGRLSSKECEIN